MYSDISPEFYTPLCCSLSQEEYYHFNMRTVCLDFEESIVTLGIFASDANLSVPVTLRRHCHSVKSRPTP